MVHHPPAASRLGLAASVGSRAGLGGCDYSMWSSPDLLTKAELFLKATTQQNSPPSRSCCCCPGNAARRCLEQRTGVWWSLLRTPPSPLPAPCWLFGLLNPPRSDGSITTCFPALFIAPCER